MKRVSLLAMSLVFAAALAATASAQPGGANPAAAQTAVAAGKVVWIDSGAFGAETGGITRYVQAAKSIETEMKPKTDELKTMQTRLQTLQTDIENIQKQANNPAANKDALAKQIQDKNDEGQALQRQFEFKQKDAQAYYSKRASEVLNPISQQIMGAMRDYAKQKGFTVILDIAAMVGDGQQNPGSILFLDPSADVTKDFITFFNSRPATTASATKPN